MIRAKNIDKETVLDILVDSFNDNKSVNYIIKQDEKRLLRIRRLMEYSYDVCNLFGDVFLSADKKSCALLLKPETKKTTVESIFLDIKFATTCLGFTNIKKAMHRESKISKVHPNKLLYYLWFIGVDSTNQNKGIGSLLMKELIFKSEQEKRMLCLETSTLKNIPWYEKFGFSVYHEFDFGYKLYSMKRG